MDERAPPRCPLLGWPVKEEEEEEEDEGQEEEEEEERVVLAAGIKDDGQHPLPPSFPYPQHPSPPHQHPPLRTGRMSGASRKYIRRVTWIAAPDSCLHETILAWNLFILISNMIQDLHFRNKCSVISSFLPSGSRPFSVWTNL